LEDIPDMSADPGHDVDHFTFEVARLMEIADDMLTKRGNVSLASVLREVEDAVPRVRSFRNAITHPMDRPLASTVSYEGAAMLVDPAG